MPVPAAPTRSIAANATAVPIAATTPDSTACSSTALWASPTCPVARTLTTEVAGS